MQHSKIIPPSSAAQWVYCAASGQAQAAIPEVESDDADVGLALHQVASDFFQNGVIAKPGDIVLGVTLEQVMLDRVQRYIDIVQDIYVNVVGAIEQMVAITLIHKECFGTPDCWTFDEDTCTLTVADYKDGHELVDAIENWQMLCYIAGIVEVHLKDQKDHLKIRVIVVQPQDYQGSKVKEWNTKYLHIEHLISRLFTAAHAAMAPDPIATAGLHCKHCRAKFQCAANSLNCHNYAVMALYNPEAPENDISIELRYLQNAHKMIGYRLAALEPVALQKIRSGEIVPYFKAGFGKGKLHWTDTSMLDNLAKMLGITIRKEAPLLTPTQAKAALKKVKLPENTLEHLTEYRQGKTKLLPADPRYANEISKEK
jgi:hypothetical protein